MEIIFQSHVPNSIDADPAISKQKFKSLDELLDHPWIKRWSTGKQEFKYYYSPHEGRWSNAILMAMWKESDSGKYMWWVLGYMNCIPDLPLWECPHEK